MIARLFADWPTDKCVRSARKGGGPVRERKHPPTRGLRCARATSDHALAIAETSMKLQKITGNAHLVIAGWVLLCVASVTRAGDGLSNGGFEFGLSAWTVEVPNGPSARAPGYEPAGTVSAQTTFQGSGFMPPVTAQEGNQFLAVGTGGRPLFTRTDLTYNIYASQSFRMLQGATLTGLALYFNGDHLPQDSTWVRIMDATGSLVATPWQQFSGDGCSTCFNSVPYGYASEWTEWEWTAPDSGLYTLQLGATSFGDDQLATFGLFDSVSIAAPVPEPETYAMVALGLVIVGVTARRRGSPLTNPANRTDG